MDFMALVIISQFGNFFYQAVNETEFKDEKEDDIAKRESSKQAGSLSNLLDLNNPQVRTKNCKNL